MNGGYLMVSKTDTNLYEKLNKALTSGKPVLWYEDENTCYYIDTITKSGTDIILTKGGKTITIESDGDITEVGDLLTIMENIVDKNGNKRFFEIEGVINTPKEGVTIEYCKASLSGTHLMLVTAGTFDADSYDITAGISLGEFTVPQWILDKIVGVWGDNFIELKTLRITQDNWTNVNSSAVLRKTSSSLTIGVPNSNNPLVIADKSGFRIQFDLLIDAE